MSSFAAGVTATAVALAVLVPMDTWVFLDARQRARSEQPVVLRVGELQIAEPAQWLAGCVLLFAVFVPAYLVARNAP